MKHPVFIVTGTSGAGKTTVIPELRKRLEDFVIYDGDSIAIKDHNVAKCNWLRIAKSNVASGIKTIICSTIVPENLFECDHTDYFDIYYINLQISDEAVIERLQNRNWDEQLIENYVGFSNWLRNNGETAFNPPLKNIDSENNSLEEVAKQIIKYINSVT